jgi:hypothetical protein
MRFSILLRLKMDSNKEKLCDLAIINTLAYRSIFKYSLSLYQLKTMLITGEEFSEELFTKELDKLIKKGKVKTRRDRYYAPGFSPVNWDLRAKNSLNHIEQSRKAFAALGFIPWVRLAGVTGSVAAFSADKKSDVDVFIVCAGNRVWLTRFFTVLILKALNKYRTDKDPTGKICPNIYVDEKHVSWPEEKRNLYVAQEIMMMHPLINKNDMYFRFIHANKWISDYTAHFKVSGEYKKPTTEVKRSGIVDTFESVVRKAQLLYMKKHKTTEITEPGLIHFNRDDWTEKIMNKYKNLTKTSRK